MKVCSKCKGNKPLSAFYKRKIAKDGRNSYCKECEHKEIYEWRKKNPAIQSEITRRCRLKRVYGITLEQYDFLLEKQKGCCAICDRHESQFKTRLVIDHNHKTGRIRGLLCNYCNHRLIGRHTDGNLLRRMADYVDGGTDWFVPPIKKKRRRRAQKPKR